MNNNKFQTNKLSSLLSDLLSGHGTHNHARKSTDNRGPAEVVNLTNQMACGVNYFENDFGVRIRIFQEILFR